MLKNIDNMSITAKLFISFALVIIVFLGTVIYSNVIFNRADFLYRYKINFVIARTEYLMEFQREFSEMRRLFKASFNNPEWLQTADTATWRVHEDSITDSYLKLIAYAESYMESAMADPLQRNRQRPDKVNIMQETLAYVNILYHDIRTNFFIGGNESHYIGAVLDYTEIIDENLQELRYLNSESVYIIRSEIDAALRFNRNITILLLVFAVFMSLALSYAMIKSYKDRIEKIKENVSYVKRGDFSAELESHGSDDEITQIITDMADIFRGLVEEINDVSSENEQGALIDADKFEGDYKEAAEAINSLILSLKETNDRVKFIFESMPLVLILWDSKYEMIDYNQEVVRRYGLANKEEYRDKYYELMPETQPDGSNSMARTAELLVSAAEKQKYEFMHSDVEGNPIPTEVYFFKGEYKGEPVILTCSVDMRGIHEFMERERVAKERMQVMFDATPLVIMYWNKNHVCIDCNQAATLFYGLSSGSKDKVNQRFYDYEIEFQPEGTPTRDFWAFQLDKTFEEGYSKFEYVVKKGRRRDDEAIVFDVICQRVKFNEDYVVVSYANDITAMKEMFKERERTVIAEASSQAKSRFLARMSHEIRTPITAVLGISEIQLQKSGLEPELEKAFSKIFSSSQTLIGIVNDILDLSKIESGSMSLIYEKYETGSIFNDIIQMHLVSISSKQFKFTVKIDENLPNALIGDELRIKQILTNTLTNAFKYTDVGEVSLSVRCVDDMRRDDYVNLVIVIADTGKGMTQEQLDGLFMEYTRFHELESRFIEGTGLGMPIVNSLVQMMGAEINVESQVHVGTTVTISIPQRVADSTPIGAKAAKSLEAFEVGYSNAVKTFKPEPMPYGSVLIVDDMETNRYVASGLLSFYEVEIETATNGQEAIDKVKDGNIYDIIFMDHMMPGLNGVETTKILREIGYDHPIVALTANALVGQAEEFINSGFDDFIAKPIVTSHLDDVMVKFIKDEHSGYEETQHDADDYYSRPEVQKMLRDDFADSQKDAMDELHAAVAEGDTESATRIAHTLKGLAGYMKEEALMAAAAAAEEAFREKGEASAETLDLLEHEFSIVLYSCEGSEG